MIMLKIIIFVLVSLVISYLFGCGLAGLIGRSIYDNIDGVCFRIVTGAVGLMLTMMLLFGVGAMINAKALPLLCIGMIIVLLIIVLGWRLRIAAGASFPVGISRSDKTAVLGRKTDVIYASLSVLILLAEILTITGYRYNNIEAIRTVPIATRVYDSGILLKGSAIMNLWGTISIVLKEHPLSFVYTVLPATSVIFFYLTYYILAKSVSGNDTKKTFIFVLIIQMLNIWGYQSKMLTPYTMLLSWFSLEAFIVHALLPLLAVLLMPLIANRRTKSENAENDLTEPMEEDYQEEWDMKKHKIINARNLAIAWAVLALMLVATVFVLNNKINTLHESTANMQQDLNSRSVVYDFVSPDGTTDGYLIKGHDGEITMIGGGKAENADALYDFLAEFGYDVTNWYLYDTEADSVGAYIECVGNKGVTVKNTYLLNRTEIKQ